jgi:phage terminase large subunit-like protein
MEPDRRLQAVARGTGAANSPDPADAMVWAMGELFEPRTEPGIRRL